MSAPVRRAVSEPRLALIIMAVVIGTVALTGGSSRYDMPGLVVMRPLLVLAAGMLAILVRPPREASLSVPLALLGLLAAIIALQLVPLPPIIWMMLPDRARYTTAAVLAGQLQPWRPLSIVPILTLNSLLALLPAAVVLFGYSRLSSKQQQLVTPTLLVIAAASAILGILQLATGEGSWAYLYGRVSEGLPDGLFANRNHQAVFLAAALPCFAVWAFQQRVTDRRSARPSPWRMVTAGAGALLALLVVLASGSRSGLVLAALDSLGATYLIVTARDAGPGRATMRIVLAVLAAGLAITMVAMWSGRGSGFARFMALKAPGEEMRFLFWPVTKRLAIDYLPWGSGFGTFDPLFRIYEPDALLVPTYLNAAHNDAIELVITGGIPAMIVLMLFLSWYVSRVMRLFAAGEQKSGTVLQARAAAMVVATFLLASLSDYPLRAPLVDVLVALACAQIERGVRSLSRTGRSLVYHQQVG